MYPTPSSPGQLQPSSAGQPPGLNVVGDWTLQHYPRLKREIERARPRLDDACPVVLDGLGALDTAGAGLLVELLGARRLTDIARWAPQLPAERQALLRTVAMAVAGAAGTEEEPERSTLKDELAHIGRVVETLWEQQRTLYGFIGLTLSTLLATLPRPRRWRITPLVAHIERTGLDAVPIVALLTFMVGAVVAFLGATVLGQFGATIYTVNLVAYSFLREFGVLLCAILMAGRTASAFAAQIGAMKANEEIDAIRALGLDPIELLVLPRVLAMLLTLPILTFIAMLCGILGGLAVCVLALDISPVQYFAILEQEIPVNHYLVGLGKAPLFAFLIAVIGCLEGFKASGSAQSVGERTTSSVVQSIFMVILIDALAALFLMEMGW
ncbi:ABC transporter protein [Azotobacter vinelandii CA]|uniref:ABC transporter protein n=2 Tax=Azotobacter vinelandii TaxID=354 RepID=C1DJE7_AZOVD|nr:ABC transporter permease [Azotobacter vinelandii]ACO76732.1 ABC transporter protein [Azotobacter vinelandii DJ]AGK17287.1 ABC transporter protein [Azotobacter vinelandii CA]AGK19324.1 ABC transporter protein [Azotobacter vinelandii CA6]WKN22493.1 ABC transporter permease [Azotobacter vinelandii]SFX81029.1 phospholipid/cholesterol/gamma-HCH transport system permease protein [Azotobacter vinelandii]